MHFIDRSIKKFISEFGKAITSYLVHTIVTFFFTKRKKKMLMTSFSQQMHYAPIQAVVRDEMTT